MPPRPRKPSKASPRLHPQPLKLNEQDFASHKEAKAEEEVQEETETEKADTSAEDNTDNSVMADFTAWAKRYCERITRLEHDNKKLSEENKKLWNEVQALRGQIQSEIEHLDKEYQIFSREVLRLVAD